MTRKRKTNQEEPVKHVPPPGEVIADRIDAYTLIANLSMSMLGSCLLNECFVYPNNLRRGMYTSGDRWGSDLHIYSSPQGTLFYGRDKQRVDGDTTVTAEKAMYESLKALPPLLTSIVKKRHPKSLGITFGIYWDATTRTWRDLTGQDPDLVNAMSFPEAGILYTKPNLRIAKIIAVDYGVPDAAEAVLSILKREPLTPEIAKQIMGTFSWKVAKEIAAVCGHPIDPSEA